MHMDHILVLNIHSPYLNLSFVQESFCTDTSKVMAEIASLPLQCALALTSPRPQKDLSVCLSVSLFLSLYLSFSLSPSPFPIFLLTGSEWHLVLGVVGH